MHDWHEWHDTRDVHRHGQGVGSGRVGSKGDVGGVVAGLGEGGVYPVVANFF